MNWAGVGSWIKENAGSGAALVGSLLTGNLPGAVAAGVSIVSGATGTDDPTKALAALQGDPETLVKLRTLAEERDADIRRHIEDLTRLELEDQQRQHETTQLTIREGDASESAWIRFNRPGMAWVSLIAGIWYVFTAGSPDGYIAAALFTLPWAYAGLRQAGKGVNAWADAVKAVKRG